VFLHFLVVSELTEHPRVLGVRRLVAVCREDKRLRKVTKQNAGLYLGHPERAPAAKAGGRDKPPYKSEAAKPLSKQRALGTRGGRRLRIHT